jgi:hypothetical protein
MLTSIVNHLALLWHRAALQTELRSLNLSSLVRATARKYTVTRLEGRTVQHDHAAGIAVVGMTPRARYLAEILLADTHEHTLFEAVPLWSLPRIMEQLTQSVDLVMARLHPRWAHLLFGDRYLRVPEWVDQWLTLPDDLDSLCRGKRGKSLRKAIRYAHEQGITCQVSHSEADLEEFYHEYHVPFVSHHFGDQARIDNLRILRRLFKLGGLIWAVQDGQRIAASAFTEQGGVFRLLTFAPAVGMPNATELGVHTALNWFEIQHARDLGCQEINFGGARGVLSDGVLRHKRKWQTRLVERKQSHLFLLGWKTLNGALCDVLAAAPLLFFEGGHLSAFSVLNSPAPASQDDVTRAYRFLWTPGLHLLHLLSPSGFEGDVMPPPRSCLVDLRSRKWHPVLADEQGHSQERRCPTGTASG